MQDDALALLLLCACDDDVFCSDEALHPVVYGAKAARGQGADDKPTAMPDDVAYAVEFSATLNTMKIECFDDETSEDFALDVAKGLGVPRDGVRVTGLYILAYELDRPHSADAREGSVIVETSLIVNGGAKAAAAVASSLFDPAKPLVDEIRFGPCAVSGVRVQESAAAAAHAEAAAPADPPAPPSAPAMTDKKPPMRAIDVVLHNDDGDRCLQEEIEGRDGGLWDHVAVSDDDNRKLDDEEEEAAAARQDSYVAPWESGGASAAAAAAGVLLQQMIGDDLTPKRESAVELNIYDEERTGVLTRREESPSPPASDDASATGCTYDDIAKPPPPHLRCVVSPLSSLPPAPLGCSAASPSCVSVARG